jgi:hypothetical protein
VQHAPSTEARDTVKDRRAREALLPEPLEQCDGQGLVVPLVRFANEDPDQNLFAIQNSHGLLLSSN